MAYEELSAKKLVDKLERAGRHPKPELIEAIWERRPETEPLLLTVFDESFEDAWSHENDPRWYRLVHAGKFMLSWQNLDALPIFGRFYATKDRSLEDMLEWFEEELFHYGPAAIPYLKDSFNSFAKDGDDNWYYGLGLSGSILTKIASHYPETRDDITAFFRSHLPPLDEIPSLEEPNEVWADIATELGELADEESREVILALHEAEIISGSFFALKDYTQQMNEGFQPEEPPEPYEVRDDYRDVYEAHQENLLREAKKQQQERESRIRQAAPRSSPKIGRNDPCPCGSGKKYKQCHGRPGS